jgi:hypothetical protein
MQTETRSIELDLLLLNTAIAAAAVGVVVSEVAGSFLGASGPVRGGAAVSAILLVLYPALRMEARTRWNRRLGFGRYLIGSLVGGSVGGLVHLLLLRLMA